MMQASIANMFNSQILGDSPRDPWVQPLEPCWAPRSVQWRGMRPVRARWWKTF